MSKEYPSRRSQNERKTRRRQGTIAAIALIATSLHLFHPEPDSQSGNEPRTGIVLAPHADLPVHMGKLTQQVLDSQEASLSGLAASALGLSPVIDQVFDSVGEPDLGFEVDVVSSCIAPDSPCGHDLTPLPHPITVTAVPPEVLPAPPVTEVIDVAAEEELAPPYNPYYDRTLPPQQKWALAQQLATDACPSGTLSQTSFALTAVMGDDHDGLLGYTDPNARIISVDVRDGHRAIDLAETVVHEQAHARDVDGQVDRRRWLDGLGYGSFPYQDTFQWFLGDYYPMPPGEAFGRLVSSALLGVEVMSESMANSGYAQDPAAETLLAQATPQQVALAGELTGCFS